MLDKNATIVIDSFTLSGWMTQASPAASRARSSTRVRSRRSVTASGWVSARSSRGRASRSCRHAATADSGIGGWDMETAARYKLPVVTVLWNNSSWGPSFDRCRCSRAAPIRSTCCRTSATTRSSPRWAATASTSRTPTRSVPALERAFKSGKPALINVIGDKTWSAPTLGGNLLGSTGSN